MNKNTILIAFLLGIATYNFAQNIGIGTNTPISIAKLDISDANRGLLIPRVALLATNNGTLPIATSATGASAVSLLVYNTATAGTGATAVSPGFYYWNGVSWARLASGTYWGTLGNVNTTDGVNFIGTTDNVPLNIRVNNQKAGRIENAGNNNTFLGFLAGNITPDGSNSTFVGGNAGQTNTAIDNTFVGSNSGAANTTGVQNTATGSFAFAANTAGAYNTAVGYRSLFLNTTGDRNTALGGISLSSNISGFQNTALGYQALQTNIAGYNNNATGYMSMYSNTVGANNSAYGVYSLWSSTAGYANVAVGDHALFYNTNGSWNTAVGDSAGINNTTGSFNTFVGHYAHASGNTFSNTVAIGNQATATSSNRVRIGNTLITNADIQVAWTITSDKNEKSNIQYDVLGLDFINQLQPVTYQYNSHLEAFGKDAPHYTGLLAQDVDKILQNMKVQSSIVAKPNADGTGAWGIRYSDLTMPLIKSVQELNTENNSLKKEMKALQAEIRLLKEILPNKMKKLVAKQ